MLRSLSATLGANLAGVLVLHASALPKDSVSPSSALPLGLEDSHGDGHAWNAAGSGFSLEAWPFGIVLLGASDSSVVLTANANETASPESAVLKGRRNAPLVEMRYPMSARGDAVTCLRDGSCLPVGGQSVWGSLKPQRLSEDGGSSGNPLASPQEPVVALAAQLDATAFFHGHAPGANAAVSSLVALLAAVDSISSSRPLASQLALLKTAPLFFLFTGEAWGEIGSRRLLTDVRDFSCTTEAEAGASSPPPSTGREPLPSGSACADPVKHDLRFLQLRKAKLASLIQIGAVGSKEGSGTLFVHTAAGSTSDAAAAALRAAAATTPLSVEVRDASGNFDLPPGPARSFHDPKLALPPPKGEQTSIATLADYDAAYTDGPRFGSRFDTIRHLNATLVCAASQVAAQAWWSLSGGEGLPSVNCSLVSELVECLLPPPMNEPIGDEARPPSSPCPLATDLKVEGDLLSHYSGVFLSSATYASISPTALLAERLLARMLERACVHVAGSGSAPCEPAVLTHDAYPPGIELDHQTGAWLVRDATEPLWAESNWPAEMYTRYYPYGAPSTAEGAALLAAGVVSAALTYAAVCLSRYRYKQQYKQL